MAFLSDTELWNNLQSFFRRHWQRLLRIRQRIWFSEQAFHLILAVGVGILGGLVNLFFYYGTEWVKLLFLHRPNDIVEIAKMMDPWERLVTPVVGGLIAGLILYLGLRIVGRQRTSNLLEVVVAGDGRLPLRTALIKFLSSLVTINTGGSIGREGGIVQLSATLASKWGQLAKWPPYRLRMLVGCGAASGIAAAYNAPISGAVFAALIVLGNFSMNLFAPVVCASVVAATVTRTFFGIDPWYKVPPFEFTKMTQLPWFILLGVAAGVMGAVFLKLLQGSEDLFARIRAPVYVRLTIGGLIVGIIAVWFPEVWGNGYEVTKWLLQDPTELVPDTSSHQSAEMVLLFLAGVVLAKLLATLVTVGSGAVGGVFTPTLFLGAGLGAFFGTSLHDLKVGMDLPVAAFTVVGMGSMLAATTRSPLLAIIMIFEISLDYSIMLPLMLACVVAIVVASRFVAESVYTEPLRRKGLSITQESTTLGATMERTVGDIMRPPVAPVRENDTLAQIATRFLTSSNNFLPVVDAKQRLIGLVALQDLKEYLSVGDELSAVIAYDVMRPPATCVTPNQRLLDVLPVVLASEQRNIPVVNSLKENLLIGAITRSEVLNLFSEAIASGSTPGVRELESGERERAESSREQPNH
ncbi:MAG TPA: ClcB-like voltage-gated chloride channel protein [Verrucomicrobiae bacterium]|nr:ClcB-like voltage-gated chloride channel protein [Verrucomicrobiae bacterium]